MRGDRIHQRRRQAVIGFKPEFLETRPDGAHLRRVDTGFNHRGHERCEYRSCRAAFSKEFRMDEVEAVERVSLVLDAAEHMRTASLAGVPLDGLRGIDDVKLVAVLKDGHVISRNHRHYRESRADRFPALGAAAGVIVSDVSLDADLHRLVLAFADQCPASKVARTLLYAVINRWVDMNSHRPILLVFDACCGTRR